MSIIKLRASEPTIDSRPGQGHSDTVAAQLAEIRASITALESDPYSEDLQSKGVAACNEMEKARRWIWKLSDTYASAMKAATPYIAATAEEKFRSAQASGVLMMGQQDVAAVRGGAMRDAQKQAQSATKNRVLKDKADEANAVASSVVEALVELSDALDAAYDDYTSPMALRETITPEKLQQIAALGASFSSMQRPMREIEQRLTGFIKRGQRDKAEMLIEATQALVLSVRDSSPPKLAARYQNASGIGAADVVDSEREIAFRLLRGFQAWRESEMPPSIKVTGAALQGLREIFNVLMGVNVQHMSNAEFRLRHLSNDSNRRGQPTPWELASNWPARFIDSGPPGWSPIAWQNGSGGLARLPKE